MRLHLPSSRQAPRLTLVLLHPRSATPRDGTPLDLRLGALAGALIAFPLGVLIGRELERRAWERSLGALPIDDEEEIEEAPRRRPRAAWRPRLPRRAPRDAADVDAHVAPV